jgi:hypothetical protein
MIFGKPKYFENKAGLICETKSVLWGRKQTLLSVPSNAVISLLGNGEELFLKKI